MATTESNKALTEEDYTKAMNFLGQNLYNALVKSVEELEPPFRTNKMVSNALSAFLINVIYKQAQGNKDACQQMLDEIVKLITMQLESIPKA